MIAVHITHEHAYHQILNEGLIKPSLVQRPDMEGFGGCCFGADVLDGDTRFVFLRLSEKYQLMTSTEYSKSGPSLRRNYPCAVRVKANKRGDIHVRSHADSY